MSWDLYLMPAVGDEDRGEWLERASEEGPDIDAARAHAEAVKAQFPDLELLGPFGHGYQVTTAVDSDLPVDVGLYGNHASISVPYWNLGDDRNARVAKMVEGIVTTVHAQTGWDAYDPQADRVVTADEIGAMFGSGHAHGVEIVNDMTASGFDIPDAGSEPKKRRFPFLK